MEKGYAGSSLCCSLRPGHVEAQRSQRRLQGHLWDSGSGTGPIYYTNWNHPDPAKQELYRKPEFRRALSHAINRQRIQRMLFFNLGEITTGTFSPKAIEFHRTEEGRELYRQWRDAYVEYNPEKLLSSWIPSES